MTTINQRLLDEVQNSLNALLLIWRDLHARGLIDTTAAQSVKEQIERNRTIIAETQTAQEAL